MLIGITLLCRKDEVQVIRDPLIARTAVEATLVTIGLICLLAAIVGGGLKGLGFEFPALQSIHRQMLLGIFGLILIITSQGSEVIEYFSKPPVHTQDTSEHLRTQATQPYFKPCTANTRNVIVASGYTDLNAGLAEVQSLRNRFPEFRFKLFKTVAADGKSNEQFAIVAGHGLNQTEAQALVKRVRNAGIATDAYDTLQPWDAECNDESNVEH